RIFAIAHQRIRDSLQQRPYVEVNATRSDLPFRRIVLIDPATREFNSSARCRMAGEWTLMLGFKTEFNVDHTWSENHVFHDVAVFRKSSGKRDSELIADGFLPLHEQARNL